VESLLRELLVDALSRSSEAAARRLAEQVAGREEHDRGPDRGCGHDQRGRDPAPEQETEGEREDRPAGQAQRSSDRVGCESQRERLDIMRVGERAQRRSVLFGAIERDIARPAEGERRDDSHDEEQQKRDLCARATAARRLGHWRSICGSSASRRPSPRRLKASTVKKIARLGKSATCGEVIMSARASLSIAPHSGVGGWAPMPINDRLAAVIIDVPIRSEKYTTTAAIVPGKMCRIT